jgi:hypothetical protein
MHFPLKLLQYYLLTPYLKPLFIGARGLGDKLASLLEPQLYFLPLYDLPSDLRINIK